jgi:hypothetical protein
MMRVNGWGISVLSVQESERRARLLQGRVSSGTCASGGASRRCQLQEVPSSTCSRGTTAATAAQSKSGKAL